MNTSHTKAILRTQRHKRLRSKVTGTADRPRLAVYRSNKFVYAQLIDDEAGKTLAAADSRKETKGTGVEKATAVGTAREGSPPANEQDARHKIGRILLPPARREYLIDSLSTSGFSGPNDKLRASSTTFLVSVRYFSKS